MSAHHCWGHLCPQQHLEPPSESVILWWPAHPRSRGLRLCPGGQGQSGPGWKLQAVLLHQQSLAQPRPVTLLEGHAAAAAAAGPAVEDLGS